MDGYTLAPTTLDEFARVADEVVGQPDVAAGRGLASALYLSFCRAFMYGDSDRLRELGEGARPFHDDDVAVVHLWIQSLVARGDGDLEGAADRAGDATEYVRRRGDDTELAWALSQQVVMEMLAGKSPAVELAFAEEALAAARRTGSRVACLYPLIAVINATQTSDPKRALEAADEVQRIDATPPRWYSAIARYLAVYVRCRQGNMSQGLRDWRELVRASDDNRERLMLSPQIASMANILAPTHPTVAIDLAAIAESDAIAAIATFAVRPHLAPLRQAQASAIAAACERAQLMDYDDTIAFVVAAIDRIIAELPAAPDD